jgi:hypothetical protein
MSESGHRAVTIRLGLLLTSVIYALALTHPKGKRWADHQTWSTVVVGVAYTLGWLALEDRQASTKAQHFFIWAAGPIVARSLALQLNDITSIFKEL